MKKRTFIVTGGTKGIGLATVRRLDAAGHRVIAIARTPPKESIPGEFVGVDLADSVATNVAINELMQSTQIDGVVNNVGLVHPAALEDVTYENFFDVLNVNLRSALQMAQAVVPGMMERGFGRIVNISSLTVLGISQRTSYAAAKSALISFARTWALELARTGITVNAVAPGPTETELFRENNPPGSEGESRYLSAVPMGRFGKPDEIAAAICFLLSDEAAFVTGQTLFVDGGASIGRLAI